MYVLTVLFVLMRVRHLRACLLQCVCLSPCVSALVGWVAHRATVDGEGDPERAAFEERQASNDHRLQEII